MSAKICHLDIESRSRCDLKVAGLHNYAAHESTEMTCACYSFDDGPVHIWVPRQTLPGDLPERVRAKLKAGAELKIRLSVPRDLREHIEAGRDVAAHKADFERLVLNGTAGKRLAFPELKREAMICTMVKCAAHGLPHALEDAAKALGSFPKKVDGVNDMRYLSKPRKDGTFCEPEDEPDRFLSLYLYCVDDVEAERDIDRTVPDLVPDERELYILDQEMNDLGWAVDLEAVADVQALIAEYKKVLVQRCQEWTGLNPSQTGALAEWCRDNGYMTLENLQADTVKEAVKDPECPEEVRRVLRLFSTYNMKAVSKYSAMERSVCSDGRLRGMFQFYGAITGRWSSKVVQLQNLYRPKIDDPETAVKAFALRDLDWIRELYDGVDPMKVFASCVRSVLVGGKGKELIFPDYSGIEARKNAWAHGEEWKLAAFAAFDRGEGPDLYTLAYARAFRIPVEQVTKQLRAIGKVMELALGYSGGVGAFVKMAENYEMDLDQLAETAWPTLPPGVLAQAYDGWEWALKKGSTYDLSQKTYVALNALKLLWRAAHPKIVDGWKQLEDTAVLAIQNPGKVYSVKNKKVAFKIQDQWLYMRLPSSRCLKYFRPSYNEADRKIRYWGVDTKTRQWCRTSTYGGKLDENLCQASSRDLLKAAKFEFRRRGYPIIGSVHDEPILEVPVGFGSMEEVNEIMCTLPKWAQGLPVAIEGHRAWRYRK